MLGKGRAIQNVGGCVQGAEPSTSSLNHPGEKQPPETSQRDHEKMGQEPRLPGRPHLVKREVAELN